MNFQNEYLSCSIKNIDNCKVSLNGNILNRQNFKNVLITAPNPSNKTSSYSGTGLPFPSSEIAFENTPNVHKVGFDGRFNCVFTYPNSYYSISKRQKIVSSIFFIFETDKNQEIVRLELEDLYPLRTLIDRYSKIGPDFYDDKHKILMIDTSEEVMKAYARLKSSNNLA